MMTVCASSNSPTSSLSISFALSLNESAAGDCHHYTYILISVVEQQRIRMAFCLSISLFLFVSSSMTSLTNLIIIDIDKLLDELTNLFHTSLFFSFSDVNLKQKKRGRACAYILFIDKGLIRCLALAAYNLENNAQKNIQLVQSVLLARREHKKKRENRRTHAKRKK